MTLKEGKLFGEVRKYTFVFLNQAFLSLGYRLSSYNDKNPSVFCLLGFNRLWFVYIFAVLFYATQFKCTCLFFICWDLFVLSQLFALFVCLFRLFKNQTEIFLYIFIIFLFFLFVCSFAVVILGITPRGEIIKC